MKAIVSIENLASNLVLTFWTPVFVGIFIAIVVYALRPRNKTLFDTCGKHAAARGLTDYELITHDIDSVSGRSTTGHEWDGIKELNTPLPRWWVLTFYATILWAVAYWVVYPAWPLVSGYTAGVLHYTNRAAVTKDLADLEAIRGDKMKVLAGASLAEIEKDPEPAFAGARARQDGVCRQLRALPRHRCGRRQGISEPQ